MGTGNPYDDLQVGVSYTVYEPAFTAGLSMRARAGRTPTAARPAPRPTCRSPTASTGAATSPFPKATRCAGTSASARPSSRPRSREPRPPRSPTGDPSSGHGLREVRCQEVRRAPGRGALPGQGQAIGPPPRVWIETYGAEHGKSDLGADDLVKIAQKRWRRSDSSLLDALSRKRYPPGQAGTARLTDAYLLDDSSSASSSARAHGGCPVRRTGAGPP
jgi:hypothetical protein